MAEAFIIDAVRTPRGRGKAGKGDDQFAGDRRKQRLGQHDEEDAEITQLGNGLDDPVGQEGTARSLQLRRALRYGRGSGGFYS